MEAAKGLPILAHDIADQATKIKGLAQFMDDAEGARTGSDSGQGFKRSLDVPVPYTKK